MPSKKQRRRREKSRRHEYEYVYVDEDGQEVEVDPEDMQKPTAARDGAASRNARTTRGGRRIQPPSWSRVGKRGLLFAPLMFITVSFLSRDLSVVARVSQTAFLLAFFLPFSYLMDSLMYRSYLRRTGAAPPESQRRRSRG